VQRTSQTHYVPVLDGQGRGAPPGVGGEAGGGPAAATLPTARATQRGEASLPSAVLCCAPPTYKLSALLCHSSVVYV